MKYLVFAWKKWKSVAHIIGTFQAQLIFSMFYLLFFSVVAVIMRVFFDPLDISRGKNKKSNFKTWQHLKEDIEQARKPY